MLRYLSADRHDMTLARIKLHTPVSSPCFQIPHYAIYPSFRNSFPQMTFCNSANYQYPFIESIPNVIGC